MKRLLRITVLFSVTLLWWGEKGYAATPAMDAAEKETVSATVEAEDAAFVVNNGAVCPVGGKVDYKYESVK